MELNLKLIPDAATAMLAVFTARTSELDAEPDPARHERLAVEIKRAAKAAADAADAERWTRMDKLRTAGCAAEEYKARITGAEQAIEAAYAALVAAQSAAEAIARAFPDATGGPDAKLPATFCTQLAAMQKPLADLRAANDKALCVLTPKAAGEFPPVLI